MMQNIHTLAFCADQAFMCGGNSWMRSGVNGIPTLAANVQAQDNERSDLFYAD
jgi:hypothetical protein